MNQKRTMHIGQLCIMLGLLLLMFGTLFIPMFHSVENSTIKEMYQFGIAPWKIMLKGCAASGVEAIQEGNIFFRISLFGIYGILFWTIIITILGFCIREMKKISYGLNILYAIFTIILFLYIRIRLIGENAEQINRIFMILVFVVTVLIIICNSIFMLFEIRHDSIVKKEAQNINLNVTQNEYENHSMNLARNDMDSQYMGIVEDIDREIITHSMEDEQDRVTIPLRENHSQTANSIPAGKSMGCIYVNKGCAKGKGFMLPQDRKVVVGKNRQKANLIIDAEYISNVHCSIRYNENRKSYIIKDHSSNGTYVDGRRLPKDVAMEYPAGTILSLANGQDEIKLG